ncbi:hypothetical protein DIPPA_14925 [Diplonema papillatum]|nr:hypothetical protein DIPPA_14925 [Diplonema papillatum]
MQPHHDEHVERFIECKDPGNRVTVIRVPFASTFETQGREAHVREEARGRFRQISICILFHRGKCRSNRRCRQLHVDPAVIDKLRDETAGPCCFVHGTCKRPDANGEVIVIELQNGARRAFDRSFFSPTRGLQEFVKKDEAVPEDHVCCLNKLSRCKWGSRCANVHFCREIDLSLIAPADSWCSSLSPSQTQSGSDGSSECDFTNDSLPNEEAFTALARFAATFGGSSQ